MGDADDVADALRASQRIHGLLEQLQLQEAAGKGAAQGGRPFVLVCEHVTPLLAVLGTVEELLLEDVPKGPGAAAAPTPEGKKRGVSLIHGLLLRAGSS